MSDRTDILVVAATARELARADGWRTLQCGVGPVEAAVTTAAAIAERRPAAILHVGVAGVRRHRALMPGSIVIGSIARYCDLPHDLPPQWAPRTVEPAPELIAAVLRVAPDAVVMPIGTSARVGGTSGCDVEAMEGFGVLRAAQLAGVPAVEVRAISNDIEEGDRARWRLDDAFTAITGLTPLLVKEFVQCVS